MRILVTGGAGYIGSHTVLRLLEEDHDVVVVDNLSNSSRESLRRVGKLTGKDVDLREVDILDESGLTEVFSDTRPESVIHFAGLKAVGESVSQPLRYYHNNVSGTLCLLRVMEEQDCRSIVFSSSATVYGEPDAVPMTEDFPLSATNPYGWSKFMIERILVDTAAADEGWRVALLRYFNPVGAHPSGEIGEDPNGIPNNLMPYIAQVAVGRLERLRVFGDDYDTLDGTGVRDYIHVLDLADGHLAALEAISERRGCHAWNLGTGRGHSVLEVVEAFRRASGREIPYVIAPRRPGDIASSYADPAKAERDLGWRASKGLAEMCADSWRWQQQNPEGYA